MRAFTCVVLVLALSIAAAPLDAQRRSRLRSLRDDPAVVASFAEVVATADPSAVIVRIDGERVALGTVVDPDGGVVTKASELGEGELTVSWSGGEGPARLVGIDEADDLALLEVSAAETGGFESVVWAAAEPIPGAWLASPDGDGTPAGIGILGAAPYRHSVDRAYLGVRLHQEPTPVRLLAVHEDTAAARAGLEPDDEILAMDGAEMDTAPEFVRAVRACKPGAIIVLKVRRGDEELELTATLLRDRRGPRSDQEPLWGPLSEVRAGFGTVLQHDTILTPESCGGPLVDLDGHAVGVNIARAGRIETLALPAAEVRAAVARIRVAATPKQDAGQSAGSGRTVVLVPMADEPSWRDDLFLIAVPIAAVTGDGEPLVCAVDARSPWRPELIDYLRRYEPDRLLWIGPDAPADRPQGIELEVVPAESALEAASAISCWSKPSAAVVYDVSDRASALAASVLAARLRLPLLPSSGGVASERLRTRLAELGVRRVISVGPTAVELPDGLRVEHLAGGLDVARRLADAPGGVDYLALTHPEDGGVVGAPRLSFAAVLLAAGRGGAVVPLPFETVWKRRFPAGEPVPEAPPGARPSRGGHRVGTVDLGAGPLTFVTGQGPDDRWWWTQVDRDGDGAFDGADEGPLHTGEVADFGDTRCVVDLDVDEKGRGTALWLTTPTPAEVRDLLESYRDAAGTEPQYLCVVGWPDAVPLAIVGDGHGIDADVVTDHPYAQTDDDPFVDVAFARFLAEDLPSATLLACRGLSYDDFSDRSWEGAFATAEWAGDSRELLERAGLQHLGHHPGAAPIDPSSPLTKVGAIVHGSHAMWTVLGKTYSWDSKVLLAPCVVESSGCSTASIDQGGKRQSVAARLLRNGAVAFFGNGRRGVAQSELYRSEVWNALLRGRTLGEAHRDALNRVLVAALEKGQTERGLFRYQLDHVAAYGDPALALHLPEPPAAESVRVEARGLRAMVTAPRRLPRIEYEPLAEWGCAFPKLYAWRGIGMGAESWWHGGEKRNQDDLLVTAEVRTRRPVIGVEPIGEVEAPLGWTGACFVDEHHDGTRSVFWRCRMIDFDMTTGEVRSSVRRLGFRLLTQ